MKELKDTINEAMKRDRRTISRNGKYTYFPKNPAELKELIVDRIQSEGPNCDLNDIDVSGITDMSFLFYESPFNGDISAWDVSNVEKMSWMFAYSSFNGDLSNWDVSSVENMSWMFSDSAFKGDIDDWNVSSVKDMKKIFWCCPMIDNPPKWYKP